METTRAYKFRIYPDINRQTAIEDSISTSQRLYNMLLEKTIEAHKSNPSSKISQRTINQFLNEIIKEDKTYLQLYANVRVDIRNRLLKTYRNFFRRCQQKKYRLAQSIQNASLNRSINMLSYKAESAGIEVIKVDAGDTTLECSNCHYIKNWGERLNLEDRIYHCNRCGMQLDMDINASINILNRATLERRGSHAHGEDARPQRKAVLVELRTYPANTGEANELYPLEDVIR